jgi:predicted HAD superfamily Cof-like phosphohydrolase
MTQKDHQKEIERARKLDPTDMVAEFHEVFKHPNPEKPILPEPGIRKMRYHLIKEELAEFKEACDKDDFVAAADALGDLLYVILGGFANFGINNEVGREIMATIHASNMSKLCLNEEEAENIVEGTTDQFGPMYYHEVLEDGRAILYRARGEKEHKVVKGPHYIKPNLSFLNNYPNVNERREEITK